MNTVMRQRSEFVSIPIKDRIQNYWTERSENFTDLRRQELQGEMASLWQEELEKYIPLNRELKILDVGTGSGFFAILLAKLGHQVTGIDLTPSMIEGAAKLAREQQVKVDFRVMDAENPEFADGSFDVVISRNLTWTLPHAEQAYRQWYRVLKKGGILLNFDADYGNEKTVEFGNLPVHHAHRQIGNRLLKECDAIKAELDISRYMRPTWDIHMLIDLGMEEMRIDMGVSKRIYTKKDALYNPTPLFAVYGIKS